MHFTLRQKSFALKDGFFISKYLLQRRIIFIKGLDLELHLGIF